LTRPADGSNDDMTSPANRDLFVRMLNALGSKDFETFESCLDPELCCEWPYVVMEGFPTQMRGARRLREALEISFAQFTPYAYRIIEIHSLEDPDRLIAEYTSHSRYLPRDKPYSNRYVGIFGFRGGRIAYWREYVNPLIVLETLGPGQDWSEDRGARRKTPQ
jgi:ketosteroid isomerase-like protein